ncbi:MAG: hypothetical protein R3282_04400 [Rhodothermales bacterium]|nr:hypothetical protein [Rhodothermales bacterium]
MKRTFTLVVASAAILMLTNSSLAQQFEAVHAVHYQSTDQAKESLDKLMKDDSMKGARVTLYAQTFGERASSHVVVEDFASYKDYMTSTDARLGSHAWSRYLLQTMDSEYRGSNLAMVVDDHGAARHTAGYLAAYLLNTTDAATYRSAIADMNTAVGNPGVLRLVALRTGNRNVTHAVLVGAADFEALNMYLDKLFASDAFAAFLAKVGDTRNVVGINMYRRVATWGN